MKTKKILLVICISLIASALFAASAYACTSVVVGKDASVDGSVMTTHTCDGWYDEIGRASCRERV